MKALITTAAIILTATFATAQKPEWVKKLAAEAKESKRFSDDFDSDRFDTDKMELVSSIEDRLTIHQEADGIKFDALKACESILVKKGHIALVIQCYAYKLNAIDVYAMNPDAEYEHAGLIVVNIPAKDVQKYAVEFFVNGQEAFKQRYSVLTGKANVDRKPL